MPAIQVKGTCLFIPPNSFSSLAWTDVLKLQSGLSSSYWTYIELTNCFQFYVITPQQNGSSVIVRLLSSLLSYESLNQMGRRREGGRKKEREGETEATRVRWYLCWTDEHRGRKKITVERKAKTYQCSQKRKEGVRERLNIKVSQ